MEKIQKSAIIIPEMLEGPMMQYREWSDAETKKFAEYVAAKKATKKIKKSKATQVKVSA